MKPCWGVMAQCTMMFIRPHWKEVFMTVHESRPERSLCSLWVLPLSTCVLHLSAYVVSTFHAIKCRATPPLPPTQTLPLIGNDRTAKEWTWESGKLCVQAAVQLHFDAYVWAMTFRNNCVSIAFATVHLLHLLLSQWYIGQCERWHLSRDL